jgi:hypothetical protein
MLAPDLSEAAALTFAAARTARKHATASRAQSAAARRSIVPGGTRRRRPQSAPIRHGRGLEGVRRQLEYEHTVARLAKSRADEDLMAVLHSRMDSQAASFAKLVRAVERDPTSRGDRSSSDAAAAAAAAAALAATAAAPLSGSLRPREFGPEPEPEPEPEPGAQEKLDAARSACLSSMDTAIAGARRANDKARLLVQQRAVREIGPRAAAAQAAARTAQLRKIDAARRLALAADQRAKLEAAAASAAVRLEAQGKAAKDATPIEKGARPESSQVEGALRHASCSAPSTGLPLVEAEAATELGAREQVTRAAAALSQRHVEVSPRATGGGLAQTVVHKSAGQDLVRHGSGALRDSVLRVDDLGQLGRGPKPTPNVELVRVAAQWQWANDDLPPHRVPELFLRTTCAPLPTSASALASSTSRCRVDFWP